MSTAWVECWKCDECGHRWIKTEKWPEQCASSKCRKRSWNKNGGSLMEQAVRNAPKGAVAIEVQTSAGDVIERRSVPSQALREICTGNLPDKWAEPMTAEQIEEMIPDPVCVVCESPMREVKGKWACQDVSCGKYGVEQRPR